MKNDSNHRPQPQAVSFAPDVEGSQTAQYVLIFGLFAAIIVFAVIYTALLNQYA